METHIVNSSNFDRNFKKLLKNKRAKNIVNGRLNLELIKLKDKTELILLLLSSLKSITGITYKIFFWEKDVIIEEFFKLNFPKKNYDKVLPYKKGKKAGIIFSDDTILDIAFLKLLLDYHLNFEMAKEPSLNLRVQICINHDNFVTLLDIYDDRGLDIYYKLYS